MDGKMGWKVSKAFARMLFSVPTHAQTYIRTCTDEQILAGKNLPASIWKRKRLTRAECEGMESSLSR